MAFVANLMLFAAVKEEIQYNTACSAQSVTSYYGVGLITSFNGL